MKIIIIIAYNFAYNFAHNFAYNFASNFAWITLGSLVQGPHAQKNGGPQAQHI